MAAKITEFLKATDPYAKTIVFCDDIDHAERMRQALVNLNPVRVKENRKCVMRITGDDAEGKAELDNFINPESRYPVIATTSKLMSTGVDAQTCKLIVLDQHILSMTEFKQIIGRGTRTNEDHGKFWFTIMDFKKATELFTDPAFDGDPVQVYEPQGDEPPVPPASGPDRAADSLASSIALRAPCDASESGKLFTDCIAALSSWLTVIPASMLTETPGGRCITSYWHVGRPGSAGDLLSVAPHRDGPVLASDLHVQAGTGPDSRQGGGYDRNGRKGIPAQGAAIADPSASRATPHRRQSHRTPRPLRPAQSPHRRCPRQAGATG